MKKPTIHQLWGMLCAALMLAACQKEASTTHDDQTGANNLVRATGALPENPALVAKVPLIISSDFYNSPNTLGAKGGGKGGRQTDSDGDGIKDASDACPTQKETINGYQDTDGCPDTAPAPTSTDSDGDGIADTGDGCPTQKETFNGYQDTDGCPDTVPDTDGDGIVDTQDGCTTEKETVNGYQDSDGCPDTPPTIITPPLTLPVNVSLTMPPVGNQGAEGSCVAWAIAYYARSCEAYYRSNANTYTLTNNIFSPEFLFNQTKSSLDCNGSSVLDALNFVVNNGICTWQSMPYTSGNCSLLPTAEQKNEAYGFKINSYSAILTSDIIAIKTLISQKHPLLLGISTDQQFDKAGPGFIWSSYSSPITSLHEVTICGYDDAKQAFKIVNSWGTAWGDAGYSWISYDFLPKLNNYLFVLN